MGEICSKSWAVHLLDAWFQCLDQHWLWHNDDIVFACELEHPRYQCWNRYFVNYWVFLIHNSGLKRIWKFEYFHGFRRGHQELLDGRLCRPNSEQWPWTSNLCTMTIVKLCWHNFTQSAYFMIFFVSSISYRPTDLSLLKIFFQKC